MRAQAPRPVTACARDTATVGVSLARYWFGIVPLVRRELRHWERWAQAIPDARLREQAVATLRDERLDAEAAAVFATLVPRARWSVLVPLLVAFQVMYDYLDTVGEEPASDPLRDGLQLHAALAAALDPELPAVDYYAHHPYSDDGGYLDALVARCRRALPALPAGAIALPHARRAAARCGSGQSFTHAAMREGDAALALWASRQDRAEGYRWWETAAGAISSVGVFALLAAATDPRTTSPDAISRGHRVLPADLCSEHAAGQLCRSRTRRGDGKPQLIRAVRHGGRGGRAAGHHRGPRGDGRTRTASRSATRRDRRRGRRLLPERGRHRQRGRRVVYRALADSLGITLTGVLVTMRLRRRMWRRASS